jgi:hypothetical protein
VGVTRQTGAFAHSKRATRRGCGIAFGIVLSLLFAPSFFGLFYQGVDLVRVDAGLLCAIRERLQAGELPWLSPLLENGGPLFARPDAQLLYPPRWLSAALPGDWGLTFQLAFHLAVAAAATAWLLRTFGARPFSAACGGIAFALCGTCLDLARHGQYLVAAPWLPLSWAAARRSLGSRASRGHLAALVAALALILLGGEPQTFAIAVVILTLESVRALLKRRRAAVRAAILIAVGVASSVAIAWAQWGPTWGELALTRREGLLPPFEVFFWSFSAPNWLGTILPGAPSQLVQPGINLFQVMTGPRNYPWNLSPYFGLLLLAAAVSALWLRRSWTAAVVFLGGLAFSLGDRTPILPNLVKVLSVMGRFRFPAKYLVVTSLAAVVLAVIAFDVAVRSSKVRRFLLGLAGLVAVGLVVAVVCVRIEAAKLDGLAEAALGAGPHASRADLPLLSDWLSGSALQALAPLVLGIGLLAFGGRLRRAAVVLLAIDVALAAPRVLQLGPSLLQLRSPLAQLREGQPDPPPVLGVQPSFSRQSFGLGARIAEMENNFATRVYLGPEIQACDGIAGGYNYTPMETRLSRRMMEIVNDEYRVGVARALGWTHVLLDKEPKDGGATALEDMPIAFPSLPEVTRQDRKIHVLKVDDPLPLVFLSRAAVLATGERNALDTMLRDSSRDELLKVIDDPMKRLPTGASLPAGDGVESVSAIWEARHRVRVEAKGSGGAVLGLRTSYLVGWRASQQGKPLPVVRATGHHVAAVVSDVASGPVLFEYLPPDLARSGAMSLAGLAAGIAAISLGLGRRARRL